MSLFVLASMIGVAQPVVDLEEILIRSDLKRPMIHEIKASQLDQAIENAALFNLLQLEKKLLSPLTLEGYRESKKSDK